MSGLAFLSLFFLFFSVEGLKSVVWVLLNLFFSSTGAGGWERTSHSRVDGFLSIDLCSWVGGYLLRVGSEREKGGGYQFEHEHKHDNLRLREHCVEVGFTSRYSLLLLAHSNSNRVTAVVRHIHPLRLRRINCHISDADAGAGSLILHLLLPQLL